MNLWTRIGAAVGVLTLMSLGLAGCDKETRTHLDEARKEFLAASESQIENAREKLRELNEKASDLSEDARERWNRDIQPDLERKIEAAKKRLREAGDAAAEGWDDAKASLSKAVDDLKKSFSDAD